MTYNTQHIKLKIEQHDTSCYKPGVIDWLILWCFNATLSNISAISWWPVLVEEEAGVFY